MTKTVHIFTPLTDMDSITSFKTEVENEIQNLLSSGILMSNIECQYQQSDKYMSCLIIIKG
jgi:hypothetical protein